MADIRHNVHDVELVRSFANTVDVDDDTDELSSTDAFSAWLRSRALLAPSEVVGDDDLALARDLRHAVRGEMASHHERSSDPVARRALDRLAAELPVRVAFADSGPDRDRPALVPVGNGAQGALARVVASVYALARDAAWDRLKICPDDTCAWAFYDESRNRSRRWCSMGVCGNRNKVRAYREREASPPARVAGSPERVSAMQRAPGPSGPSPKAMRTASKTSEPERPVAEGDESGEPERASAMQRARPERPVAEGDESGEYE